MLVLLHVMAKGRLTLLRQLLEAQATACIHACYTSCQRKSAPQRRMSRSRAIYTASATSRDAGQHRGLTAGRNGSSAPPPSQHPRHPKPTSCWGSSHHQHCGHHLHLHAEHLLVLAAASRHAAARRHSASARAGLAAAGHHAHGQRRVVLHGGLPWPGVGGPAPGRRRVPAWPVDRPCRPCLPSLALGDRAATHRPAPQLEVLARAAV